MARFSLAVLLLCLAICDVRSSSAQRTFNLNNACAYTVWPGTLSNAGTATLWQGGTTLAPGAAYQYVAPAGWAGRLWGRTGCSFDAANAGVCETGDCGAGLYCNGAGGVPPATLVEFTLDGYGGQDFYDVSLVDGYNLPLSIQAVGGTSASNGTCGSPGCATDLNTICPLELQETVNGAVVACKSACEVFQTDNYCCSGTFNSPSVCVATNYSQTFKSACPTAYSYAFDDVSSTFTCPGAPVYTITFCPSGTSTGAGTPPAVNATVPPPPLVIAAPPPPPLSNLSTPPPLALVPPPPPLVLVPPPPSVTSLIPPPPPNVTSLIPPPPPNVTSLIPPPPPNTTGLLYPPPPPPLNSSGLLYPPPPPPLNVTGLYPPPPPPLGFIYPPPPPFTVANGPYSPPVVVEAPPYDSGTTNSAAKFSVSVSFQILLLLCCYFATALAIAWLSN